MALRVIENTSGAAIGGAAIKVRVIEETEYGVSAGPPIQVIFVTDGPLVGGEPIDVVLETVGARRGGSPIKVYNAT